MIAPPRTTLQICTGDGWASEVARPLFLTQNMNCGDSGLGDGSMLAPAGEDFDSLSLVWQGDGKQEEESYAVW